LMIGSRSFGKAMGSLNEVLNARRSANLDSFSFFRRSFFFCWSRSFSSDTKALNLGATSSGCLVSLCPTTGFAAEGLIGKLTVVTLEVAGLERTCACWEILELSGSLVVFEDLEAVIAEDGLSSGCEAGSGIDAVIFMFCGVCVEGACLELAVDDGGCRVPRLAVAPFRAPGGTYAPSLRITAPYLSSSSIPLSSTTGIPLSSWT